MGRSTQHSSWLDSYAAWVVRRRAVVLLAVAVVTVAGAVPMLDLRVGYSVQSFLESEDPPLKAAAAHYSEFGIPDNLVLFCYREADPYSVDAQDRLQEIDRALRELDGVERVLTLASAPGIGRGNGEWLRTRVERSHTWRDLLVSKRGDALGGVIVLDRGDASPGARRELFERLRGLPEFAGLELTLAGIPYHRSAVISLIRRDQMWFVPLGTVMTTVLLLWFIPCVSVALLTLIVCPLTLIATFGTMGLLGVEVTLLTSALPVLLMCIAVASAVHLVGRFLEERRAGLAPERAAARALAQLVMPCFLTAATTAIGFLTLTFSSIPDLRELGVFAALGVSYAYLFTITALPALLSMIGAQPQPERRDLIAAVARAAIRVAHWPPRRVLVPAAVTLGLAGWAAAHVKRDNYMTGDLWPDSQLARDIDFYQQRFLSMTPSEVLVTSPTGFGSGSARRELSDLVEWLESLPAVDRSISIVDLLRDNMPMLLVRGAGAIGGLLSKDGNTARVLLFQQDFGNRYFADFFDRVAEKGREFPHLDVRVAGVQVVATTLLDRLTGVLGRSFLGSLLVILGLIWFHFRSFRFGIIAVVPNLFPLVANLALMTLTGMELRPLTVISFCVAFGLAVDDTVHLLSRFAEERQAGRDPLSAIERTLATAGRPVIITTTLLLAGFLAILTSNFKGTFQFGGLVSAALFGSLLGALFLLPALLRAAYRSRGD